MNKLTINGWADGARKKDGRGGYGFVYYYEGKTYFAGGFAVDVTNQVMELRAAIELLEGITSSMPRVDCPSIMFTSDSAYLVNGFNTWMHSWHKRDWNRGTVSHRKEVSNLELWKHLFSLDILYKIKAKWERGHSGHPENDLCDLIANYCCIHKVNISGCIETSKTKSILGAYELSSFVKVVEDPFKKSGY